MGRREKRRRPTRVEKIKGQPATRPAGKRSEGGFRPMANLEDLSASARGLIIGTMNDLDGEYLKCLNMVSLCDIIIEKETQDETISVFTVVLRQYWAFRMGMLSEINNCLSALDLHCDEVDRFVRHNMLGNDAPGPVNQPFPAETPA